MEVHSWCTVSIRRRKCWGVISRGGTARQVGAVPWAGQDGPRKGALHPTCFAGRAVGRGVDGAALLAGAALDALVARGGRVNAAGRAALALAQPVSPLVLVLAGAVVTRSGAWFKGIQVQG